MKKQLIQPDTGDWADHDVAYAEGVVVHTDEAKRVYISGTVSDADGIETQTRDVLERIESMLASVGGDLRDVVRVRVYLNEPALSAESLEAVHEVRNEFFDGEHLPASTLVEVENMVTEEYLIEIDADAVIPDDGWEVKSI